MHGGWCFGKDGVGGLRNRLIEDVMMMNIHFVYTAVLVYLTYYLRTHRRRLSTLPRPLQNKVQRR